MLACHADDPGSIPGGCNFSFFVVGHCDTLVHFMLRKLSTALLIEATELLQLDSAVSW